MNTIRKRELQGYFYTSVGYVFIGVFLIISSILFYVGILKPRSGELPNFIYTMSYLWMLLCPILTMRLLAEEKQKKTDQLLLTSPISLPGIVMGKYLAAVTVLLITAGMTLLFVLVVAIYGRVYPAELAVNYLGFILQGCGAGIRRQPDAVDPGRDVQPDPGGLDFRNPQVPVPVPAEREHDQDGAAEHSGNPV